MTVSITKPTPREQAEIIRWPELLDIGIIPASTGIKKVFFDDWQHLDFSTVDFKTNLARGVYDNGIAIRTGKTISGKRYLVVLDFDGWDAVVEWFSNWDNVLALSKKTLVEWHEDKDRIHVFLFSPEPLMSKRITIKNACLEIRCENEKGIGQLVFVSPSIHLGGKRYAALDTNSIEEMQPIDLLRIKERISRLCAEYMSNEDKQAYIKWLEDPANYTKLGVGQGRHDALVTLGTSYFYRYLDDWENLTDDERKERLWKYNQGFAVPKTGKEFNEIWNWIIEKHTANRKKEKEERQKYQRRKTRHNKRAEEKVAK